jgi:hypothetical protein
MTVVVQVDRVSDRGEEVTTEQSFQSKVLLRLADFKNIWVGESEKKICEYTAVPNIRAPTQ